MNKLTLFIFSLISTIGISQEVELQKVLPDSVVSNQRFAYRVAIDGNTMIVSSGGSEVLDIEKNNLVYVYEKTGSNEWTQTQILHHNDFLKYSLGCTVAIYDGFIFVTYKGITNQNRSLNRVGVYTKNGVGRWEMSQELYLHGRYHGGYGYNITAKNGQLIIATSAKNMNINPETKVKHADVFELENGKWVWKSEVLSVGIAKYNNLGTVVDIEGDKAFVNGNYSDPTSEPIWYSTITATDEQGRIIIQKTGACRSEDPKVFVFSNKGGKWENTQILAPWDKQGWGFGNAFAAHGDYLAVGADRASLEENKNLGGAVYIFRIDANGDYQPFQRVMANDLHEIQQFGTAVSITDQYLIVGAKEDRLDATGHNKKDRTGACYVFQKDTNGRFVQTQKFVSDKRQKMGYFGRDIAISSNSLIIGSGYQSVTPQYRGDFHDEGAAFGAELIPVKVEEIDVEDLVISEPIAKLEISVPITTLDTTNVSHVDGEDIQVNVFPNPTNGNFTLKRKIAQNSKVIIYETNGKAIYKGEFKELEQHFSIEGLSSGLYYVQIHTSGIVQNLKLVLVD